MFALFINISANEHRKFFPMSGRSIGTANTTRHWMEVPGVAAFANIVRTCNSPDGMRQVARSSPLTRHLLPFLQDNEVGMSIVATLAMEMNKFEPIAALYLTNTKGRKVSMKSVLKGKYSVTRLPFHHKAIETLSPLTRFHLSKLQQRVLAENVKDRLVPMLLDELALLPGGVDLALSAIMGREAGLCPVVAFQSYHLARKTFGREKLDAILSTNKTFICFHLPDPEDAEAAAKRFARFEGLVRSDNASSSSKGGSSSGWSVSIQPVDNVIPGMIQGLNVPTPGNPFIEFYMVTIPFKPFFGRIHIPSLVDAFFPKCTPAIPPEPRDGRDMVLPPWGDDDRKRLRLI